MKKYSFVSSHLLLLCLWALSFLFTVPCAYARKVEKAEKPLSEIFKQLKRQKGAVVTPVNYTGTFGPNDAGVTGFTMQRRDGDGWTRGERVVIAHPQPSLVESVRREFEQLGQLNQDQCFLRIGSVGASAYFEKSRTFYCYEQAKDGTLYFLCVTTENEICVPVEWKTVDYYNQPAKNRSQANYFRRLPRSDQYVLALSRLWSGARRNFVFMNRVKLNWDSLYVAYLPLLKSAKSDDEATRLLQRMTATLRDGHTFVYSTSPTQKPVSAPLSTVLLEGKVYVDQVWNQDLLDRGVRRGMELVAIDGDDVGRQAHHAECFFIHAAMAQPLHLQQQRTRQEPEWRAREAHFEGWTTKLHGEIPHQRQAQYHAAPAARHELSAVVGRYRLPAHQPVYG